MTSADFETALTHRIWTDPDFARLAQTSPAQALAQLGVQIPEGVEIEIVVQRPDTLHFAIPGSPRISGYRFQQTQMDIWEAVTASSGSTPLTRPPTCSPSDPQCAPKGPNDAADTPWKRTTVKSAQIPSTGTAS